MSYLRRQKGAFSFYPSCTFTSYSANETLNNQIYVYCFISKINTFSAK